MGGVRPVRMACCLVGDDVSCPQTWSVVRSGGCGWGSLVRPYAGNEGTGPTTAAPAGPGVGGSKWAWWGHLLHSPAGLDKKGELLDKSDYFKQSNSVGNLYVMHNVLCEYKDT